MAIPMEASVESHKGNIPRDKYYAGTTYEVKYTVSLDRRLFTLTASILTRIPNSS